MKSFRHLNGVRCNHLHSSCPSWPPQLTWCCCWTPRWHLLPLLLEVAYPSVFSGVVPPVVSDVLTPHSFLEPFVFGLLPPVQVPWSGKDTWRGTQRLPWPPQVRSLSVAPRTPLPSTRTGPRRSKVRSPLFSRPPSSTFSSAGAALLSPTVSS